MAVKCTYIFLNHFTYQWNNIPKKYFFSQYYECTSYTKYFCIFYYLSENISLFSREKIPKVMIICVHLITMNLFHFSFAKNVYRVAAWIAFGHTWKNPFSERTVPIELEITSF